MLRTSVVHDSGHLRTTGNIPVVRQLRRSAVAVAAVAWYTSLAASPDIQWLFPVRALSQRDQAVLQTGRAVVAVLPARSRDFAAFGAVRFERPGEQLVRWTRSLPRAHTNKYMVAIGRFSTPPVVADVEGLRLDARDLDDLRRCRPGACGVQLSDAEILAIRQVIDRAGSRWPVEAQAAFRRLVVERARRYLEAGLAGTPPYHDHDRPVAPAEELAAILGQARLEESGVIPSPTRLLASDTLDPPPIDSFLYWSVEAFDGAKPVVSIVHSRLYEPSTPTGVEALRVDTQVYATHYFSASLTLIGVTRPNADGARHLVYQRRVRGAVFDGVFGGVVRSVVGRRIRRDAPAAIEQLRRQIEATDTDAPGHSR